MRTLIELLVFSLIAFGVIFTVLLWVLPASGEEHCEDLNFLDPSGRLGVVCSSTPTAEEYCDQARRELDAYDATYTPYLATATVIGAYGIIEQLNDNRLPLLDRLEILCPSTPTPFIPPTLTPTVATSTATASPTITATNTHTPTPTATPTATAYPTPTEVPTMTSTQIPYIGTPIPTPYDPPTWVPPTIVEPSVSPIHYDPTPTPQPPIVVRVETEPPAPASGGVGLFTWLAIAAAVLTPVATILATVYKIKSGKSE